MSTFRPFSIFIFAALLPSIARPQTTAGKPSAATTHSHTPAPSAHVSGTVTLDQFITSATPFPRNQVELAQSTTVLSDQSLWLKQQASLGETLSAETGMSATSFGPGASRPVIRGLSGDRIRLLENSVGTLDASVASPDHAVSVEPLLIERIEVIRGPASLLYGSNAVGGVVNVITHRIETDLPAESVRGGAEVRGNTAAQEFARGGVIDFAPFRRASQAVVFHFDGFRRETKDLRIPGFAESASFREAEAVEAAEQGEAAPIPAEKRLPNSALSTKSGAAGVSYVSPSFHLGASYSGLDSHYGVPGHAHAGGEGAETDAAGTQINLRQRRTDMQGEWHREAALIKGVRFKLGLARYRHLEIEPNGDVGTVFTNRGYDGRVELLHGDGKPWTGAMGVQSSRSEFAAAGEEAFLPPSLTRSHALFAFEEVNRGGLTWQFGGRFEHSEVTAEGPAGRSFEGLSGSLGAVKSLAEGYALTASIAHTTRAPNAQELFANGPHAGTQSFEIGDRTLRAEKSLGVEVSLRRRTGRVTGALTVFTNQFNRYIFEQPTDLVAVDRGGSWELAAPDDPGAREDGLPVFNTAQIDARFWGAELETLWHLHERTDWQLDLRVAGDFTRARADDRNLPRIPAARLMTGLHWARHGTSAGIDYQHVLDQERVAPGETPSDGYGLLSAYVGYSIEAGRMNWELFVRGTNLLNEEVRPHTSFVKDLAPLAGRGATAGVRLRF